MLELKTSDNLKTVLEYLPQTIRRSIDKLSSSCREGIQEIRLRCERPAAVYENGREQFLTLDGVLTSHPINNVILVSRDDIIRTFQAVVSYSVYSHEQDVADGFVTIRGGCRVGICGTAVRQGERVQNLRNIAGLNFRIAGEYPGTAAAVWQQTGQNGSILVAGAVGSGKTTFLRDLCRLIGDSRRTSLVDERGEIAAVYRGAPQHDVGLMTDVLDGYPRAVGIMTALRVLSPAYIICDEISTPEDANAILQASGCGVQFVASAHVGSLEALRERTVLRPLLEANVFRYAVLLCGSGKVQTIRRLSVR